MSDIAGAGAGKSAIGREMECVAIRPGQQLRVRARIIVQAAAAKVRSEQGIELHVLAGEAKGDENYVARRIRSEEHTSELQSLMRNSYAVFCLKKKNTKQ